MNLSDTLNSRIDSLVSDAFSELHPEKPFIPGETNIPVTGKVFGSMIKNIQKGEPMKTRMIPGIICFFVLAFGYTYFILPRFTEESSETNVLSDIKSVIFNYKILFTSFFAGLMVGPMEGFADAWGSGFLMNVYGIDNESMFRLPIPELL